MKPLISKCSMIPAWHQLVPISGHVEESETARKLQLYATSIKTSVSTPGGGTRIIFWRGVRPEVWNPYPYLRIFLPQKTADLNLFFEIFANRDPFLRVFLPQNGWFNNFFAIFAKWDPLLRIFFWPKWDPCLRIFAEKVTHLGGTSPYALTCEYPPPGCQPHYRHRVFEGRSRASYGLTRPDFVHHFSPRKPAL